MDLYDKTYLPLNTYAPLPIALTKQQKCVSCGVVFRECENIGRHLCRIHPGLKFVDSRTNRVSYSCCNYAPGSYGFDVNLLSRGCLQMDHQGALLINDAIDPRMQQLRSFGLLVMPKVILPLLMTRVMASTILYDSEHFSSDVFKHSFDVLEGVVASYHEKGLSATTYKETRLSCGDWASGLGISWEIDSLLRDLTIKSSASPLFCRLMPELNANKGEVVVRENDAIWKGSMPQRRDTSKITPVAIPFVIIARINNALDGAVK
jgi:hypothetical protein